MALRIVAPPPADKLGDFQRLGRNVNGYFSLIRSNTLTGTPTDATVVLSALLAGIAFAAMISAQDPDLVTAYRTWTGQTNAQIQADASATLTALNAVTAAILSVYPLDGTRHMLDRIMDTEGNVSSVMLSAATLAPVSTAIAGWNSAIQ